MTIPTIPDGLPPSLLGAFADLRELFPLQEYAAARDGRYRISEGFFPLKGLPGTVLTSRIVTVGLWRKDLEAAQARCLNGVVDHFRCIRSAALMAHGLLPVYCADGYGTSFLLAYVPYSENSTYDRKAR